MGEIMLTDGIYYMSVSLVAKLKLSWYICTV